MGVQISPYTNPVLFWGVFEVRGTSKGVGVILTRFFLEIFMILVFVGFETRCLW
uniref:Uncharacterized kinetoplast minicircle 201 polypeptide n=1 Tax=Trypanosoma brucei brucei TaxID=5702 RepID=YKM1_TRYBB|nr:RecName: Full=Uncharacterized kinetoplast minicircle 201 polypeptide [Trypanosoma brucei brucei]